MNLKLLNPLRLILIQHLQQTKPLPVKFSMIPRLLFASLCFFLGFITVFTAQAEVAVPNLNARITDLTQTLSTEQMTHIEQNLSALEKEKGSQLAVLIMPTTQPETIEAFSLRVAEKWALGRKKADDGVLLLIAKNDRKVRIEVGDGLEGAITDASAGRIINEFITPKFRQNQFYNGVLAGVKQIENLIKGEPLPAPTKSQGSSIDESAIFIMVFASSFIAPFLSSILGRILTILLITFGGAGFIWLTSQDLPLTIFATLVLGIFSIAFSALNSSKYRDGGGHGGGGGFGGGGGGLGGGGGGFRGGRRRF